MVAGAFCLTCCIPRVLGMADVIIPALKKDRHGKYFKKILAVMVITFLEVVGAQSENWRNHIICLFQQVGSFKCLWTIDGYFV